MPYVANGKNLMLDALATAVDFCALHSGIPDASGSNEISGGSPAYARKAITWAAASGGSVSKNGTSPVFDVPASTTVYFVGWWDAVTTGTFHGYAPCNGGTVKGVGAALASSDVITSYAHGLLDTEQVTLQTVNGEAIPTGLGATTVYFVRDKTTDTFKLALTSGGTAINITTDGELAFQKVIPEVFASQATFTLTTGTMELNG